MQPLYAYRTLFGDLELSVAELRIDDADPGGDTVDAQFNLVSLYALERQDWTFATLSLVVAGPADEIGELGVAGEPAVTAVAFCSATNARQAVSLTRSQVDPALWTGDLELQRENFYGKVEMWALLTATVDAVPHRWIGESAKWNVHFEEPAVLPIEGTLRVRWAEFENDRPEVIPMSAAREVFYIDLESSVPTIYLNSDFEGLPDLLSEERGRPDAETALRDAEYRRIATAAWSEIFNVAVAAIRPGDDGQEPSWPSVDWQEKALHSLLPRIYDMTLSEALSRAFADATGDGALGLHARAQLAIAKEIGAGRSLRRSLDRLNRKKANPDD